MLGYKEYVSLKISCHLYISVFLKFVACYVTGQWGEFKIKNVIYCFHVPFKHFFVVFHHKVCVFIIFGSFFDKVPNFRIRKLLNQKQEFTIRNCQSNSRWKLSYLRSMFYILNEILTKECLITQSTLMVINTVNHFIGSITLKKTIFNIQVETNRIESKYFKSGDSKRNVCEINFFGDRLTDRI